MQKENIGQDNTCNVSWTDTTWVTLTQHQAPGEGNNMITCDIIMWNVTLLHTTPLFSSTQSKRSSATKLNLLLLEGQRTGLHTGL